MADGSDFQVVSRKARKKRDRRGKNRSHQATNNTDNNVDDCDVDRIITQIETYREEIQASSFYAELKSLFKESTNSDQNKKSDYEESTLEKSPNFENKHCSHCCTALQDIVCYGIGCMRTCPNARYQLALLILLKDFLKVSSQDCLIYEPLFNESDEAIVKHFGFSLIEENEEAKRTVRQPTLFYMPHCSKLLYNNLIWANWGPSLNNVAIFGNTFSNYKERLTSQLKDIFNDLSLHSFNHNTLEQLPKDFWLPRSEPVYDINDQEIVTKQ